jgi:hypothetical protein
VCIDRGGVRLDALKLRLPPPMSTGMLRAVLLVPLSVSVPPAMAHGALAIGAPENVAQDGLAMGVAWDMPDASTARAQALSHCRNFERAPAKTRNLCKVVNTFSRACVSVALDPQTENGAWGWGVASTLPEAEKIALRECRYTLMQFCFLVIRDCDTTP